MNAGILYMTDEYVDYNRTNIKEQIEDILDDGANFQMKEYTNDESLYKLIHDSLGNPKIGVTAYNLYENYDNLYAGYYIDLTEIHDQQNAQFNKFAVQITSQNVTSALVIVKKKINFEVISNNVKTYILMDTLSQHELVNVIENIFVKEGIVIDTNGTMTSYKYIVNPLEHQILHENDYENYYVYHEFEVYTHIMIVIAQIKEINGILNETATLLSGKPVNGTVYVAMYKKPDYNETPPYVGISVPILNKILKIRQKCASITTGMQRSQDEYINFEKILELENIKHKDKISLLASNIQGELLNIGKIKENL